MSGIQHFTVRVVRVDVLPSAKYIPGMTYDGHKETIAEHDIRMDGNELFLPTSPQDLVSLCQSFLPDWRGIPIEERLVAAFFNHVVRKAIDDHGSYVRAPVACHEFILLRSPPLTLWNKDSVATIGDDPMRVDTGLYIHPGDVIEMRAVREYSPPCCICHTDKSNVVLQPCRHLCMCKNCHNHWKKTCMRQNKPLSCPVCRTTSTDWVSVYGAVETNVDVKVCTHMPIESCLNMLRDLNL